MKTLLKMFLLAVVATLVLAACGGSETAKNDCELPAWVDMGGAAFPGDAGRVFYGVGSAQKSMDPTIQRERAKVRAKAALAAQLETYVASMKKDYASSTSDGNAETIENQFEMVNKEVTAQTMSGVQLANTFRDNCNGVLHVLVKMDFNQMKDALEKSKQLNSQVKDYISKNAERLHDELKAEEEKRK